jgi:hypothetical protein
MGETVQSRARLIAALEGRLGVALCVLAHVALATSSFASDRFLHDEGLLTHIFARITAEEPWPAFFLLKTRPPISVLYAPFSAMSLEMFWAAHVVVAAAAIPLWAGVARALGHRAPALVGAVVGLSPLLIAGGAAGFSNTDAVTGLGLFSWLLVVKKRRLAAGLVLGLLPFIRAELSLWVLLMLAWELWHRRPAVAVGFAVLPGLYALGGAVYHRELLWMLYWPPALPAPMEGNPFWDSHTGGASLAQLWGTMLAIIPGVGLALFVRWRALSWFERLGALFVIAFVGALVVLPRWQVFNFDQSPRYLLPMLPFVALLLGRVVEQWRGPQPRPRTAETVMLFALLGLALLAEQTSGSMAALAVVAVWAAAIAAARWQRPALAVGMVLVLTAVGPFVLIEGGQIERSSRSPHLDGIAERLGAHAEALERQPVFTNEPLLEVYLARSGGLPHVQVHYLVQADQLHETTVLTNPANGQRAAISRALRRWLYGRPVLPGELEPEHVPAGAFFVLTDDPRLDLVLPPKAWDHRLSVLYPGHRVTISTVKGEAHE